MRLQDGRLESNTPSCHNPQSITKQSLALEASQTSSDCPGRARQTQIGLQNTLRGDSRGIKSQRSGPMILHGRVPCKSSGEDRSHGTNTGDASFQEQDDFVIYVVLC